MMGLNSIKKIIREHSISHAIKIYYRYKEGRGLMKDIREEKTKLLTFILVVSLDRRYRRRIYNLDRDDKFHAAAFEGFDLGQRRNQDGAVVSRYLEGERWWLLGDIGGNLAGRYPATRGTTEPSNNSHIENRC
jgi:hypothetical protein